MEEVKYEDIVQTLEKSLGDLRLLVSEQQKVRRTLYSSVSEEIQSKRNSLATMQARLSEEIQELEQEAQERNAAIHTQLEILAAQESECRSEIARVAKLLTPEDGAEGLKIEQEGGWKIAVSKIKSSVTYKTDDLLQAMPEFEQAQIDGDRLVEKHVNPSVLSRLVASGEIEEEDIEPFRVLVAERKPTVRITTGEVNE